MHRLAELWFPEEKYGEPMPGFEFDGRQGLDRFMSAVNLPRQRYYRTVHQKAAALFRSLVKNHSLRDGNKRLGVTAMQVFLIINDVDFKVPQDLIVQAALALAQWEGNFPLEIITRWVKTGCTGRPRSIIQEMAEEWPQFKQVLLYESRQADIRAGKKSRIPGRRVRLSKEFLDHMKNDTNDTPEQLELPTP
jgi:death-on-curing protein